MQYCILDTYSLISYMMTGQLQKSSNYYLHWQIANVIDSHAASLHKSSDKDSFYLTTQGIMQLVQRYAASSL